LLIDYLVRHENIDRDMAEHQVTEFTEDLVKALASGKEVNLEGIGTLKKIGEDKVEFIQAGKAAPKRSPKKSPEKKPDETPAEKTVTFELEPENTSSAAKTAGAGKSATGRKKDEKSRKAETQPKVSKSAEKKSQGSDKTVREPEKKSPENDTIPLEPEKKQPARPVQEVSINTPPPQPPKEVPEKTAEAKIPQASFNRPVPPVPPVPPVKQVPAKSNKKQMILWIALVVIAIVLINLWVIRHDQIRNFFGGRPVADTLGLLVESDTMMGQEVMADSLYVPQELPDDNVIAEEDLVTVTPPAETEKLPVTGEKRYYIVAGCFGDEANADAMVKKLKEKGFSAQKYGKRGNLYCVSYSAFTDRDKAITELEKIRNEEDPDAWLNEY